MLAGASLLVVPIARAQGGPDVVPAVEVPGLIVVDESVVLPDGRLLSRADVEALAIEVADAQAVVDEVLPGLYRRAQADPALAELLAGALTGSLPGVLPDDVDESSPPVPDRVLVLPDEESTPLARLAAAERILGPGLATLHQLNGGVQYGIGPAVFPVGDHYEYVDSWGDSRSGGRRHEGTDILAPEGTPLHAVESGVITQVSSHHLGGLTLKILGDSGSLYYYAHLSAYGPQVVGDHVTVGEIVGYVGDTGNARGTDHLHFQWSPSGEEGGWVNPYPLLAALEASWWTPPVQALNLDGSPAEPETSGQPDAPPQP